MNRKANWPAIAKPFVALGGALLLIFVLLCSEYGVVGCSATAKGYFP